MFIFDLGNFKVNSEKNKVGGDDKVINILQYKFVCFGVKYFKC